MSDDREFDRMLEDELSALPPPDGAVREVTPWRRAMGRVVWGIGLTTVTVSALWLDYILPAVGTALLVLGFRTLRRENRWLTACWALSLWAPAPWSSRLLYPFSSMKRCECPHSIIKEGISI